jgi:signal transduction histidine kinase
MRFSRPVTVYIIWILVLGLALTAYSLLRYPLGGDIMEWVLAVAFTVLVILAKNHGLHLMVGTRIDVDTIPLFATVLVFNPGMAMLIALVGFLASRLRQRPTWEAMFNLGEILLYVGAGSYALHVFTATPWVPTTWQAWVGVLATVIVMYLVNTGLIAGIVSLTNHINFFRFWISSVPVDLLEQSVMYAFGWLTALVVVPYPWGLVLLAVPSVAVFLTLDRTLQTEARHKQLAEQNAGLAAHLSEQAEQLREAYAVLEDAMDAKNQMLQNVSHELRTPLVSIYGYTEALQEGLYGDVSTNQLSALDIIYRNTQQMIRLVNDLLALQTLDRSQLQVSDVYLSDLFQQAGATFAPRAEAANIDLQIECDDRIPMLHADAPRLEQVIGNLVDNAIKFSPNGGNVLLKAKSLDQFTLELMVADQGIGIPKEELPRIYRRFYQVDGSSTRKYGGQGLGLAIAKRIVELHGGGIRAESEVGTGTTFYLTLPVSVPASGFKLADED